MKKKNKGFKKILKETNFRFLFYGMFSNWGLVIASNIIGLAFINVIGINFVKLFHPLVYLLFSVVFYFPTPKLRDFRLGYLLGFAVGLVFLLKFYYPLFLGV